MMCLTRTLSQGCQQSPSNTKLRQMSSTSWQVKSKIGHPTRRLLEVGACGFHNCVRKVFGTSQRNFLFGQPKQAAVLSKAELHYLKSFNTHDGSIEPALQCTVLC